MALASQLQTREPAQGGHKRVALKDWRPAVLVGAVYLAFVVPYSLLTPAWEANDEIDHTMYIEHIVADGSLPRISLANGVESHQPPLYYLLAALWQKLLQIPAFVPSALGASHTAAQLRSGHYLALSHHYTRVQHQDAVYVHELRVLSVLFGLATVLLSYGCARLIFRRPAAALATGLTVALLPKQLVVDAVITNDSLVITLCTLSLFLFLLAEKARRSRQYGRRRWLMLALGTGLGLAATAKFNSLPLAVVLVVMGCVPALKVRRLWLDSFLMVGGFFVVSGWWFIRNQVLYGQFLASGISLSYLKPWAAALDRPVPWLDRSRFLDFVPRQLFTNVWYNGDWNQWVLPGWINLILWLLAAASLASVAFSVFRRRWQRDLGPSTTRLMVIAIPASVLSGVAAVLLIAKVSLQAQGRIAFVGLTGFCCLLVWGTDRWRRRGRSRHHGLFVWPLALAALNIYVFSVFVVPFAGL